MGAGERAAKLPGIVLTLGWVSFFTDLSSEMIYPLLPLFLTQTLGAGPLALGLIEGIAEATAAWLKLYAGRWSDRVKRRKPFVWAGYGIAGLVRPLIGLAGSWPMVLALRFADRIGKGLRSSPRDALIADAVPPTQRGQAFGLHRAMDHAGSVAGPLVAAALAAGFGYGPREIFLAAAVPAAITMLLLWRLKEPPKLPLAEGLAAPAADAGPARRPTFSLRSEWQNMGADFKSFLAAMLLFTLGNATDAFFLLAFAQVGVPAVGLALIWAAHHLVKMVSAYFFGILADRLERRLLIGLGWALYAAIYLGFALCEQSNAMMVLFLIYGLVFGITEPAEKAYAADLARPDQRGTAFGYYHAAVGFAALPASLLFGLVWQIQGRAAAFVMGGLLALAALAILRIRLKAKG